MQLGSRAASVLMVLTFALCLVATPGTARADWPPFGRTLCAVPGHQLSPAIASDGAGGSIVAWTDFRAPQTRIFAQRVLASGEVDANWPANGKVLLADSLALVGEPEPPAFPVIVADGAGGAIVAWQEGRSGVTGADIFAQHVLASGALDPAWPANGVPLCSVAGVQDIPAIVSDGAGGAIVTWMDGRSSETSVDIYAQHVLPSGVVDPAWPVNGAALCTAPSPQAFPNLATDGSGGAIVTWFDFRPAASGIDIYAQHVTAAGIVNPAWPANGLAICTAANSQFSPTIVADGAQGAVIAWYDFRNGVNNIFAQRVQVTGSIAPGWPVNGRAICTAPGEQVDPVLVPDLAGGAVIAWRDTRGGIHRMFAQRVMASGVVDPAWPVDGRALSTVARDQRDHAIASDGAGGAFVTWLDGAGVFAQRVLADGTLDPAFPAEGRSVSSLPGQKDAVAIVADDSGGAIVTWPEVRGGSDFDLFALQVMAAGTVDVPGSAASPVSFAPPSPNPAQGPLTLRFTLAREAQVRLAIYDVSGRRVRELESGARPAGLHALQWDLRDERGHAVGAGLYFARLEAERLVLTRRLVTLK